jgi:hypothetical protein
MLATNSYAELLDAKCDQCSPEVAYEYTHICKECPARLCSSHVLNHQNDRLTSNHKLEKIEGAHSFLNFGMICDEHPPQISKLYCIDCQLFVCHLCIYSDRHKNHTFKVISELPASVKKELDAKNYWSLSDELVQRKVKIDSRINLNQKCRDEAISTLEEWLNSQKLLIEEQFQQERNKIIDFYARKHEALLEDSRTASLSLEDLQTAQKHTQGQIDGSKKFDIIRKARRYSEIGDAGNPMISAFPAFEFQRLLLKKPDVLHFEYAIDLPFTVAFFWDEEVAAYNIYLEPNIDGSMDADFGTGLYLTETDIDGNVRRCDCTSLVKEAKNNRFNICQIQERYFERLSVYIADSDALIASYIEGLEIDSNSWSERKVIQQLFLANDFQNLSYDNEKRSFVSEYSKDWDYEKGKLKSMYI